MGVVNTGALEHLGWETTGDKQTVHENTTAKKEERRTSCDTMETQISNLSFKNEESVFSIFTLSLP